MGFFLFSLALVVVIVFAVCELIVLSPQVFGLEVAWNAALRVEREKIFSPSQVRGVPFQIGTGEGGGCGRTRCKPRIEMRFVLVFLLNSALCLFFPFFFLAVSEANYLDFSHVSVSTSP